jgi:hypothetical protein
MSLFLFGGDVEVPRSSTLVVCDDSDESDAASWHDHAC